MQPDRRGKQVLRVWPKFEDLSRDLENLGRTAIQVVRECVRPLREGIGGDECGRVLGHMHALDPKGLPAEAGDIIKQRASQATR